MVNQLANILEVEVNMCREVYVIHVYSNRYGGFSAGITTEIDEQRRVFVRPWKEQYLDR